MRAGVGVMLAVVLLTGCGGDDEPGAAGSEATPTLEPTEDTSTATAEDFCADIETVKDRLENLENIPDVADPQAAVDTLEESVDALRSVDPPAEIAEDWSTVVGAFEDITTSLRNLDTGDPAALAEQLEDLSAQMEKQSAAIEEAGTRIDQYLNDECGITID